MSMTDKELFEKLEKLGVEYRGSLSDLNEIVGMFMMGRLYGWRVQRLVTTYRIWSLAIKLVGDPKKILPELGPYAHKSVALNMIEDIGNYWDFIAGRTDRGGLSLQDRKLVQ